MGTSQPFCSLAYMNIICPICRSLEAQDTFFAASRALLSDGSRIEISSAMIPMTTSNSTSVNPPNRLPLCLSMIGPVSGARWLRKGVEMDRLQQGAVASSCPTRRVDVTGSKLRPPWRYRTPTLKTYRNLSTLQETFPDLMKNFINSAMALYLIIGWHWVNGL